MVSLIIHPHLQSRDTDITFSMQVYHREGQTIRYSQAASYDILPRLGQGTVHGVPSCQPSIFHPSSIFHPFFSSERLLV